MNGVDRVVARIHGIQQRFSARPGPGRFDALLTDASAATAPAPVAAQPAGGARVEWLTAHAASYGWAPLDIEPWQWEFTGRR